MSLFGFNQYDAIPGHKFGFEDGNLNLKSDPLAADTEAILLMGTATDGPIMQPIRVTPETAYTIFGKVKNDSGISNNATLLPAFEDAWQAGNRNISLMRVTGKTAKATLAGTSFNEYKTQATSESIIGHGNKELEFTLPHGGIIESSFKILAEGVPLPLIAYTLDVGTSEILDIDGDVATPATKATILIEKDVCNMEAELTVDYTYEVEDHDGTKIPYNVVENSTAYDPTGTTLISMIALGADRVLTLNQIPKEGLRIYVNDVELLDKSLYTLKAAERKLTLHPTGLINLLDTVEIAYSYDESVQVLPEIQLESVYGGGIYNRIVSKVEKSAEGIVTITIEKPDIKKSIMSEDPMVFKSIHFPNFQLLVNAINTHPYNNNVVRATVSPTFASTLTSSLEPKTSIPFSGGSDEINLSKEEMYKRLGGVKDSEGYTVEQGAYQYLENYKTDYVIPLGVNADDQLIGKFDNFAYQLALGCAVMSHYNHVTIGLIQTSTPTSVTLKGIEEHVQKLEKQENLFYMRDRFGTIIQDGDGERIDLGQFIEIIAGPDLLIPNTRLGLMASNTPASYAGFVSQLPISSAPTNKALPTVKGLRFEYSNAQLNRLTKARYVTYRVKPTGQVGIVDAMTAAHVGSDYQRLSTVRAVKEACNQVREVCDPFIGEANEASNHNAMSSAIEKRLSLLVEKKALLDYDFQVIVSPTMELLGEGQIELSLRAPRELRNLTTIVSLT